MRRNLSLKLGSLNIQGSAKVKCETTDIIRLIEKHHIFSICETWLEKGDACPLIPLYTPFRTERKKHPKAIRNSGGIIMFIKNDIIRGVTKVLARANSGGDAIWIRLDKNFFGTEDHIFMCGGYIVPRADQENFEILRKEIEHFSNLGKVCLLGDFNARTGVSQPDQFLLDPDNNHDIVMPLHVMPRNSLDKKINENGNKILSLLTNYDLLIGNGCIMGDLEGQLTCSSWNGFSTNDVFILHRDLFSHISYLKIDDDFQWYSDHKSVTVSLRVNLLTDKANNNNSWKKIFKKRMVWDSNSISKYKEILENEDTIRTLETFNNTNFTSSDDAVRIFTDILNGVLSKVFPKKSRKVRNNHMRNRDNFSYACQVAKRAFKRAQRQLSADQFNMDRRHRFIIERRNYRRAIYSAKRMAKVKQIDKLSQLEKYDSKAFWKGLKDIISPKDNSLQSIDKSEWVEHFEKVLNEPAARLSDTQFVEYVKSSIAVLENTTAVNNSLNKSISDNEIAATIKDLKIGKAVFNDNIGNEALKHGYLYFKESLNLMLNKVFSSGVFPKSWADGMIIPLHKKGAKTDVNNFRGIVISSCVSKVLLRILTKRIDDFMSQNGKWSIFQCGFKKDHRTEDNLFVLNTIHNKYVKGMNKDIYVAFIDFSKFFDKINRDMMMYKLLKYGINGSLYSIIKSLYSCTGYQVQIGDDLSPIFYGNNGLKQGCCLSPTLSSIYQNDMHDHFRSEECDPIQLGSLSLNSISWADDLIMISLSSNGLQNCLSRLERYCKKWGLEINELKTKCMVMSRRRGPFDPVYINNAQLEYVNTMSYLGFHINRNGNIRATIEDRIAKASRVSHMVLQALRTNRNVSAKLTMNLFDKQIVPILLYGSSIWAMPQSQNLFYLEEQPENHNTRAIVASMLRLVLNKDVPVEYARRVGRRASNETAPRKILVKLKFYSDKQELFRSINENSYVITNFVEKENDIEKVHHDFCKKSLNISKNASNMAVQAELGRNPVMNSAKSFAVKYWLRLKSGTQNNILNEAFDECSRNNHEWMQGIQSLLCENGYGNVWINPESVNKDTFHKVLRERLNDQHIQKLNAKLNESNRFKTLQVLYNDHKLKRYITIVRDPEIREIYTRLRVDMNILSTSKIQGSGNSDVCPMCHLEPESVGHFLFRCEKYCDVRNGLLEGIKSQQNSSYFNYLHENDKLKFILSLDCPTEVIGKCCRFVHDMYKARLKDSSMYA